MTKTLVFVAGMSDAYPMEFYDFDSESIQGAIPNLLREFSEQSNYEILYWRRGEGLEHVQVDLVSHLSVKGEVADSDIKVVLYETQLGEVIYEYWVSPTEAAPQGLIEALRKHVSQVGQEKRLGYVTEVMQKPLELRVQRLTMGMFFMTIGLIVTTIALIVWIGKYRKQRQRETDIQYTDGLTGLGNREFLKYHYEYSIQISEKVLYSLFLFRMDDDKIEKMTNRATLQELLCHVATSLREVTTEVDWVARVDERTFAVMRVSGNDEEQKVWLNEVKRKISCFGRASCRIDQWIMVGVVALSGVERSFDETLYLASRAAEQAIETGEQIVYVDEQVERSVAEERELQIDVERAIKEREFELYIQFYVDAQSGLIVGGEALTRWEHPEKGFLLPGRFVPLMEREGYIDRMDYLILEKACLFLEELQDKTQGDFFLSCNFSRKTFASANFVENCLEIMGKYDLSKNLLIFEMTESASVDDFEMMLQNAEKMKSHGVRIALDDFGEKFTSFFDLQEYPVDMIKLDKRLIDNIETPKGRAILNGVIQVGHDMGLIILGEGVEEESQVQILRKLECDIMQGFRFHYPIPAWSAKKKLLT